MQFVNGVNNFPVSFEDYTKNCFGIFYFEKTDNVNVYSYWIMTKPYDQVLSTYDQDLFEWSDLTTSLDYGIQEFLSSSIVYKDCAHSLLH